MDYSGESRDCMLVIGEARSRGVDIVDVYLAAGYWRTRTVVVPIYFYADRKDH